MKKNIFTLSLAVAAFLLVSQQVNAQGNRNCGQRDAVVQRLNTKYGETRQSMGLGQNNAVIELFASEETGTWTITVTLPNGMTCLVASGQAFEHVDENLAHISETDA